MVDDGDFLIMRTERQRLTTMLSWPCEWSINTAKRTVIDTKPSMSILSQTRAICSHSFKMNSDWLFSASRQLISSTIFVILFSCLENRSIPGEDETSSCQSIGGDPSVCRVSRKSELLVGLFFQCLLWTREWTSLDFSLEVWLEPRALRDRRKGAVFMVGLCSSEFRTLPRRKLVSWNAKSALVPGVDCTSVVTGQLHNACFFD